MSKEQFNLSIDNKIKRDFTIKCKNECRELSSVIEFLIKEFINCKITIPEYKIKNE